MRRACIPVLALLLILASGVEVFAEEDLPPPIVRPSARPPWSQPVPGAVPPAPASADRVPPPAPAAPAEGDRVPPPAAPQAAAPMKRPATMPDGSPVPPMTRRLAPAAPRAAPVAPGDRVPPPAPPAAGAATPAAPVLPPWNEADRSRSDPYWASSITQPRRWEGPASQGTAARPAPSDDRVPPPAWPREDERPVQLPDPAPEGARPVQLPDPAGEGDALPPLVDPEPIDAIGPRVPEAPQPAAPRAPSPPVPWSTPVDPAELEARRAAEARLFVPRERYRPPADPEWASSITRPKPRGWERRADAPAPEPASVPDVRESGSPYLPNPAWAPRGWRLVRPAPRPAPRAPSRPAWSAPYGGDARPAAPAARPAWSAPYQPAAPAAPRGVPAPRPPRPAPVAPAPYRPLEEGSSALPPPPPAR